MDAERIVKMMEGLSVMAGLVFSGQSGVHFLVLAPLKCGKKSAVSVMWQQSVSSAVWLYSSNAGGLRRGK